MLPYSTASAEANIRIVGALDLWLDFFLRLKGKTEVCFQVEIV
jgi:hypothetical protein